jgi:hypothetical protein
VDDDVIDLFPDENGDFGVDGGLDDLVNAGRSLLEDTTREAVDKGKEVVSDRGASAVEQILRSSEFNKVLLKVEDAARQGVVKEAGKNAIALFALAVAGGAIGGTLLKGKIGLGGAAGITLWSMWMLTKQPPPTKTVGAVRLNGLPAHLRGR